jgi:hypothetical protein
MKTNGAGCTWEVESRISMAEATFNKKKALFNSRLDLNLWKKLVERYICSTALCGAETWTLVKVYQKCQESLKSGAGEGWIRCSWIDRVINKVVSQRVEDERTVKRRRLTGFVTCCVGTSF